MKKLTIILTLIAAASISGCAVYDVEAHGRYDYDADVRISWGVGNYYYDPAYGVYVSFGYPSSYWADGYYYYFSGSHWMRSNHWHGPWLTVAPKFVPTRVHGYRSHVYSHPERYPRVRLRPSHRYEDSRSRQQYSHSHSDRYRDESRKNERYSSDNQSQRYAHRPDEGSSSDARSRYEDKRRRDDRGHLESSAEQQRPATSGRRTDSQPRSDARKSSEAHRQHRQEPRKIRLRETKNDSPERSRRSHD